MAPADEPAAQTARLRIEPLRTMSSRRLFDALADARIYTYVPDDGCTRPSIRSPSATRSSNAALRRAWRSLAQRGRCNASIPALDIGTLQATVTPGFARVRRLRAHAFGLGTRLSRDRGVPLAARHALQRRFVLNEIMATVDVRNLPSLRVLERLGFRLHRHRARRDSRRSHHRLPLPAGLRMTAMRCHDAGIDGMDRNSH